MVTALKPVMFAAATAEMHEYTTPALVYDCLHDTAGIGRMDRALESMKDRDDRPGGCTVACPAQIHEIAIRQFQAFAEVWLFIVPMKKPWPECLQMGITAVRRGYECVGIHDETCFELSLVLYPETMRVKSGIPRVTEP
jgi:hypothetical protein